MAQLLETERDDLRERLARAERERDDARLVATANKDAWVRVANDLDDAAARHDQLLGWLTRLAIDADMNEPAAFGKGWSAGQVVRYVRAAVADRAYPEEGGDAVKLYRERLARAEGDANAALTAQAVKLTDAVAAVREADALLDTHHSVAWAMDVTAWRDRTKAMRDGEPGPDWRGLCEQLRGRLRTVKRRHSCELGTGVSGPSACMGCEQVNRDADALAAYDAALAGSKDGE